MSWHLKGQEELASWRGEARRPGQKGRQVHRPVQGVAGPRGRGSSGEGFGLFSEDKEALKRTKQGSEVTRIVSKHPSGRRDCGGGGGGREAAVRSPWRGRWRWWVGQWLCRWMW